jgi:hypothetical protein
LDKICKKAKKIQEIRKSTFNWKIFPQHGSLKSAPNVRVNFPSNEEKYVLKQVKILVIQMEKFGKQVKKVRKKEKFSPKI